MAMGIWLGAVLFFLLGLPIEVTAESAPLRVFVRGVFFGINVRLFGHTEEKKKDLSPKTFKKKKKRLGAFRLIENVCRFARLDVECVSLPICPAEASEAALRYGRVLVLTDLLEAWLHRRFSGVRIRDGAIRLLPFADRISFTFHLQTTLGGCLAGLFCALWERRRTTV